jgi:hypothetical protein
MSSTGLIKYAGALVALAMSTACSGAIGGSTVAPSSVAAPSVQYIGKMALVNGKPVTAARPHFNSVAPYSSLLNDLDATSKAKTYEYIISDYGTYASIFDYPKGTKQIGSINDVGGQGCSNVLYGYGKKTFWIMAGTDDMNEYSVPDKFIRSLDAPSGANPSSCAMDTSGDLAVGILYGSDPGYIIIYKNATGKGQAIPTPLSREYFDGYDNQGNLFFDGFTSSYAFQLDEIAKGSTQVQQISTSNTVQFPGSVQWDGKYLVVTDQVALDMYRYTVTGTKAKLVDTIPLTGSGDCAQTWIATGVVYCADASNDNGAVYPYPKGGKAIATFKGNFDLPLGTVAAEK